MSIVTVQVTWFQHNDKKHWITIKRGNKYIPYGSQPSGDPIYYWNVINTSIGTSDGEQLYFINPDTTSLINVDNCIYYGECSNNDKCMIYTYLKYRSIKLHPMYFIARNVKQIASALKLVSYCTVTRNHIIH